MLRACDALERVGGVATLDASAVTMFGPLGAALVAAAASTRRARGQETRFVPPLDEEARHFVEEIGFDDVVCGRASEGSGTRALRQLRALDPSYTHEIAELLMRGVPGTDETTAYPVQLCLNELLQNVFEWSHSTVGCIVLSRWYRKTRSVRIAVVDRGIGIPAALRQKRVEGLHRKSDADVIVAAVTTAKLTSRVGRAGGLGLKTIREVVCGRGGRMTVVSQGAKVVWSGERRAIYRSLPLRGTAIELDFRPTAPFGDPGDYVALF